MMVMLPMRCALFLFSRSCCVSFVPGRAQRVGRDVPGQLPHLSRHLRLIFRR
jgi:hypothetical protein